jgi:hypothetical protein
MNNTQLHSSNTLCPCSALLPVLTVAAVAGIQADLKTFAALGRYGMTPSPL